MKSKTIGMIMLVGITGLAAFIGYKAAGGERLALLDENIATIHLSESNGVGEMNEEVVASYVNREFITTVETVLRSATLQTEQPPSALPDYDVQVEYEGNLPVHALHLWLGNSGEPAFVTYMIGEGEVYSISAKQADKLRELIQ